MKNILLIYVVVFVNNMNALDFSQRGRILGYNPPPPPPESYRRLSAAIIEERFIQKLDHFDPTSGDTWSQRYFVNTEYFHTTKRNVAFLMIGPEAASSIGWMNYGSWIVSAKKYNALLFQLEHRFYGDSQPFPIQSENIQKRLLSETQLTFSSACKLAQASELAEKQVKFFVENSTSNVHYVQRYGKAGRSMEEAQEKSEKKQAKVLVMVNVKSVVVISTRKCPAVRWRDVSFKNLRYLSSQQALADLANFIVAMNEKYQLSSDIKWILFGGSYAGALAAWMREKYPHLVHGAISSSGPLFAKLDFHEYFQVVADDLADSSQECVDTVKVAMKQVEELLNSPDVKNLTDIFNLCSPIEEDLNNPWDLAYFSQIITVPFAAAAQYSNIPGITFTTNDLCDILTNNAYGTEIYRLGVVNSFYYGTNCLNYHYDDVIEYLKDTDVELLGGKHYTFY
ncbi:hypothetical protein NQ314_005660 [Rhamnusium bicolor]|uniref:Serine protease K12H4.7 n=1 Tax=Rhamnusium bicolor TaxID=1586634 RepID=A0AAV8ZF43_9CUCU|nr:hypothetical protein NQ314_005660 [Rhamnusium bicolor]